MDAVLLLVLLAVGCACGALEKRHLGNRGLNLYANLVFGAAGAFAGGQFFDTWGQLAPGLLAPVASGVIGAAVVLPPVNWIGVRLGLGAAR